MLMLNTTIYVLIAFPGEPGLASPAFYVFLLVPGKKLGDVAGALLAVVSKH